MACPEVGYAIIQRVDHLVVVEEFGQTQMACVAGDGVEVEPRLVNSAELVAEHQAACLLADAVELPVGPVGKLCGNLKSFLIPLHHILVDESAEELVERVPWRPDPLAAHVAVYQLFGEGADVAVADGFLHLRQTVHKAQLEYLGTGSRVHQRVGRKQMAGGMAAQVAVERLPAAELFDAFISSFQSGEHSVSVPETVQQPFSADICHPGRVAAEIVVQTARQQPHRRKRKCLRLHLRHIFHFQQRVGTSGIYRLGGRTDCGGACQRQHAASEHLFHRE